VHSFEPERIVRVPFSPSAQPVHPGVAKHFGLAWVAPGQLYPVNQEGLFDFETFCRRYMRFAWNAALHRGIEKARTHPADALPDLEEGLEESPDSALGARALAVARYAAGLTEQEPPAAVLEEDSYEPAEDPWPLPAAPVADEADAAEAPEAAAEAAAEAAEPSAGAIDEGEPFAELDSSFAGPAPEPERPVPRDISFGTTHDGFTDFGPRGGGKTTELQALAAPGSDLIDVLPRLLPVFTDLSGASERPFSSMPEVMPPPPLRPILPPELQGEAPKKGFFGRLLGRKSQ
jgi:hypothetical protein